MIRCGVVKELGSSRRRQAGEGRGGRADRVAGNPRSDDIDCPGRDDRGRSPRSRSSLLRHQRPHPDHLGLLQRRRRAAFFHYLEMGIFGIRPSDIDVEGLGELVRLVPNAPGHRPTSRSASRRARGDPTPSTSSTRSGLTTCCHPSASPSPGSRPAASRWGRHDHQRLRSLQGRHRTVELAHGGTDACREHLRGPAGR